MFLLRNITRNYLKIIFLYALYVRIYTCILSKIARDAFTNLHARWTKQQRRIFCSSWETLHVRDSDSQDFSRLSSKEQSLIHSVSTRANFCRRRDDSRSISICSRENRRRKREIFTSMTKDIFGWIDLNHFMNFYDISIFIYVCLHA